VAMDIIPTNKSDTSSIVHFMGTSFELVNVILPTLVAPWQRS
jgi:hypothetical protein